jgi:integrase
LTAKKIEDWHRGLALKPALARSRPGRKANHRKADKSADGVRKRRATANRILTVLKAALNHAWKSSHVASDDAWRRVKPFRAVETARVRYLSEDECIRLVNACEPAFRNLARGALLTGCRYSELTAMHVADFNADAGVITVRESKVGKPRHVVLTDEGQHLFATLTVGKLSDEPIFTRRDGGTWGKSHQLRPMVEALPAGEDQTSGLISYPSAHAWFHARHAGRAHGRYRRTARSLRHAHDRKALRASCPELCRCDDTRAFPNTRYRW